MRTIDVRDITQMVAQLCVDAAYHLGEDVLGALRDAAEREVSPLGKRVLDMLLENAAIAAQGEFPLCQDTGFTLVFVDVGQDVHLVGGDLSEAVSEGVRLGYDQGYLRKSVVTRPFSTRINTGDNTPPVIHTRIVPGEQVRLAVMLKGGGSENMSYLRVFPPAAGRQGVVDYVVDCVRQSGANPCPPVIVGVGIGGTVDQTTLLAKRALLRQVGQPNEDAEVAALEADMLAQVNALGIGPQGLGGVVTALAVQVEVFPSHIASLPVAVTMQCHSARHKEAIL